MALLVIITVIIAIVVGFGIIPYIFMLLWNFTMNGCFNLPAITFWHALAICTLISITGSFFSKR